VVPAGRLCAQIQPRLAAQELLIRPWQSTDAPSVLDAYSDPAIRKWHVRSMTEPEVLAWLKSRSDHWAAETGADWAVIEHGDLLGRVGLRALNLSEGTGEAAYWVLPGARGRGVAPRALCTVTDWMFAHLGLHRVELLHSTANEASCRVAHKAGYALEGTKRQSGLFADGWHDMHLHARLQGDIS
jgi:RimJ/RimL family protein N-acetyltransferase